MARQLKNVWDDISSWQNLAHAHRLARRGKISKKEVARFHLNWESEVTRLEEELKTLRWQPGPFRTFTLYEGKPRQISAVPYRDRVVHQAIMNILGPHLERTFIFDTYACRQGKGTEAARARVQRFLQGHRYVLHLDVVRFFPSILQATLKTQLRRHVADGQLLEILDRIIDHSGPEMPDDLVERATRRGLPIGSLTSQWFANLYLSPLDHFIKEQLRVRGYSRYMDDLVLLGNEKTVLWKWESAVRSFVFERLGLELHGSPRLAPSDEGVSFLGMEIFSHYRRLLPPSGYRYRRRMKGAVRAFMRGDIELERLQSQAAGWLDHARGANTVALRRALYHDIIGRCPEARTA